MFFIIVLGDMIIRRYRSLPQGAVSLCSTLPALRYGPNMLLSHVPITPPDLIIKKPPNGGSFTIGRGDMIRTCDTLLPKQVLYQAELRPDAWYFILFCLKNQALF